MVRMPLDKGGKVLIRHLLRSNSSPRCLLLWLVQTPLPFFPQQVKEPFDGIASIIVSGLSRSQDLLQERLWNWWVRGADKRSDWCKAGELSQRSNGQQDLKTATSSQQKRPLVAYHVL